MTDNLISLLQEEKQLWQDFYELTLSQQNCLTPEKTEDLLKLVDEKEDCIKSLKKLQEKISSIEDDHKEVVQENPKVIIELKAEISQLIQKAKALDTTNRSILINHFSEYKKELGQYQAAKGAVLKYSKDLSAGKGYFIDTNR